MLGILRGGGLMRVLGLLQTFSLLTLAVTEASVEGGIALAVGDDVSDHDDTGLRVNHGVDDKGHSVAPGTEEPEEDNSVANELEFDVSDSDTSVVSRVRYPPNRRKRRSRRSKYISQSVPQQSQVEPPLQAPYLPSDAQRPASSGFSSTQTGNRSIISRWTLLVALLAAVAVAWAGKQVGTYRNATANLSVLRSDYQQILTQVEASDSTSLRWKTNQTQSGGLNPSTLRAAESHELLAMDRDAESKEEERKLALLIELSVARVRLAELERKVEAARSVLSTDHAELPELVAGTVTETPPTHEETIQEKLKLEEELERLKQQRQDLEAVVRLQEQITADEAFVVDHTAKALSIGGNLGAPEALYRSLLELQRAYAQLGDNCKLSEVKRLKGKLNDTLVSARKTCAGARGLDEVHLLIERDNLEAELSSLRERIAMFGSPSASTTLSRLASMTSYPVRGCAYLIRKAAGELYSRWTKHDEDKAADRAKETFERARAEREKERNMENEEIDKLQEDLEKLHLSFTFEQPLLSRIHLLGGKEFEAWLASMYSQAALATEAILTALRTQPGAMLSKPRCAAEIHVGYAGALDSAVSAAAIVLEKVQQ